MAGIDVKGLLDSMRPQLEKDQAEGRLRGITVDEMLGAFSHPKAPDAIAELIAIEAQSVKQGDLAPDFTLPRLTGHGAPVTLSSHRGKRPVALVFGSYT